MSRLHFLLLDGDNVKGDFSDWSRELNWLQWINSDLTALPSKLGSAQFDFQQEVNANLAQ
jgi:hypothetical protein